MKCHVCKIDLSPGHQRHVYACSTDSSRATVRLSFLRFNSERPDLVESSEFHRLYEVERRSANELGKLLGLSQSSVHWLLREFGLKTRSVKDSCDAIRLGKIQDTCRGRYGVDNPSQSEEVKIRKVEAFRKNHGVDNVFQALWFKEHLRLTMQERYGAGSLPNRHGRMQEWWDSQTEARKKLHMKPAQRGYLNWLSSLTEEELHAHHASQASKLVSNYNSRLEQRVAGILSTAGIPHLPQKWVAKRSYDFWISSSKVLIEVNGDFWHANPDTYHADDTLSFPGGPATAASVWARDLLKMELAQRYGYQVLTLWETDMKKMSDEDLLQEILRFVTEVSLR